ncbi:MAG: putative RND superfamily exporter protein [Halioglobus sp.]|jgi:predicted RND superfamily exporter protein
MSVYQKMIEFLVRYTLPISLVNLLLMLAIAFGGSHLSIEAGIRVLFSPDDPNLLAEIKIEETYGKEDNILLVVDAIDGDIFTADHLATIENMTAEAWQVPNSRRVDSVTNYLYTSVDGDELTIGPLIEGAREFSPQRLAQIREVALAQEAILGRLIAPAGNVAAVNISLNLHADGKAAALEASVNYARKIARQAEADNPGVQVHIAGLALTEQTLAEVTASDGATLIPGLFAMVLVVLALSLRSTLAALCTVITIALSVVVGMGYAGWAGLAINSVNVSAPTIIMTLAVADCIHLLSHFLRHLNAGVEKREAVLLSMRENLYPVILTSVTTAIGFGSMNFSDSPPFGELGTISAVGVMAALWVSMTLLPGLMLSLPFKGSSKPRREWPLESLANWVVGNHKSIFWIGLATVLVIISFIPRMALNDDPAGYFSDAIPLTKAIRVVEDKLSGTQNVHYSLDSGEPGGVADPQYLKQVGGFVDWLRAQPEVTNVESFVHTLKRLNQVMHEDDSEWYRLPDERALAAQYLLLYEISVPYGQDVTYQVSADKSALKVTAVLKNQKSRVLDFEERSRKWLNDNAPELVTRGAGHAISFASIGLRNINNMLVGSVLAIILVSTCLIFAFRSLRFGLVSFIPNLFPALVSLGIWSAVVHEVNMAASVVFSMTLGIVVDDTTHFLVKYREARTVRQLDPANAIREVFTTVGRALVATSAVLAAGFLVLAQSNFSVNSTSGILMSLTIIIALLLDLLFLPALLLKLDRWLVPGH